MMTSAGEEIASLASASDRPLADAVAYPTRASSAVSAPRTDASGSTTKMRFFTAGRD